MPHRASSIVVDGAVAAPPCTQIFEQIRALIERGELAAGDPLPPVRQLAGDLGVAPNTVVRAYADLKAGGWVVSEDRKLTRVAPGSAKLARSTRREALREAVNAFLNALASRGYDRDEIAAELRTRLPAFER